MTPENSRRYSRTLSPIGPRHTTQPVPNVAQQAFSLPDLFATLRGAPPSAQPTITPGSYFSVPHPAIAARESSPPRSLTPPRHTPSGPRHIRPRSNSMDETHNTSGGIRSQFRTETPALYRTAMANTASRTPRPRDTFGLNRRGGAPDHFAVSSNDAEVHTLHQADQHVPAMLRRVRPGQTAHLEFHGNEGPCDDCKQRITTAARSWSQHLPSGSSLVVHTLYSQPPQDTVRGRDRIPTTYGWHSDVTAPQIQYGNRSTRLYHHQESFPGPQPPTTSIHGSPPTARQRSPSTPSSGQQSTSSTPRTTPRLSPTSSGIRSGGRGRASTTTPSRSPASSTSFQGSRTPSNMRPTDPSHRGGGRGGHRGGRGRGRGQ